MRTYLLSGAGVIAALCSATSVNAYTVTYGTSLASACYRYSLSNRGNSDAVRTCSRAIEEEPLSPFDELATMVNRGIIQMNLGAFRPAEADFDQAIARDRNYPEAYLNKAFLRLRQDQPSAAIDLIDQSIERQTREPALARYARGVANERLGHLRAAYEDFRKAQELAPNWSLPRQELERYSVRSR